MDLLLTLDRRASQPLQTQLVAQLRRAAVEGRLRQGDRLPATRDLARSLGVSRSVVVVAYDELVAEGLAEGRAGSGTYVCASLATTGAAGSEEPLAPSTAPFAPRWLAPDPPPRHRAAEPVSGAIEFRPGRASVAPLPVRVWRSIWGAVADEPPPGDYGSPAGEERLRAAIAGHLARARGIAPTSDRVVVTGGVVQALDLLARATVRPGTRVGCEEPGAPAARAVFAAHGARLVPIPVDADGVRVECLPIGDAAPPVLYVTPSHQYPLGGRLPIGRRLALLEWAAVHGTLVVEDDYDSEFRYDAAPLPALAGLAAGVTGAEVAYVGTFSKILTPALRAGYAVVPPPLRERMLDLKLVTDYHTPWPLQRALTAFVEGGHLERHVRRMRRHYAANRAELLAALAPILGIARPLGIAAGLHACLELRPPLSASPVATAARERGVLVTTLRDYYIDDPEREGLVLGYGGLSRDEIRHGAGILVGALLDEWSRVGIEDGPDADRSEA